MLEAVKLSKRYKRKRVLSDVSFSLAPGECLGIAGHNGSGKSTLLAILAQVTPPDSGDILAEGSSVLGNRRFLRHMVGYVPQQTGLLPDLTVKETLQYWQKLYGVSGNLLFSPSSPASMMGLDNLQKKLVGTLSGGMQKRLSITLALLHNPWYLFFDEVLPGLDRHYRQVLLNYLAEYRKLGNSVIYCSHGTAELLEFCDKIMVLQGGMNAFLDDAEHFPTQPKMLDSLLNPLRE